jgi:tetratricopeptide (TPR) repeat protein
MPCALCPLPSRSSLVPVAIIAAVAAMIAYANWRDAERSRLIKPGEVAAAVRSADGLLRDARVSGSAGLAYRAEEILEKTLRHDPGNYDVKRALGAVYLSQHRFEEAIAIGERNAAERPYDPVNYGVIGDGHIELGHYPQAFDAFDRMMAIRPGAAAYARVAYARELQGNLTGALESMKLAVAATPPADREGLAWAEAQVGELNLQLGRLRDAKDAFVAASQAFPGHPFAVVGYAKAIAAEGDLNRALQLLVDLQKRSPTPDLAARIGDLLTKLSRGEEAERQYQLAEAGWRADMPEPRNLARFLATHERKTGEAVTIAEQAAASRDDIFTNDALAWAYFKAGRTADANKAMGRALRTGTRDRDILEHAAAIRTAASAQQVASR